MVSSGPAVLVQHLTIILQTLPLLWTKVYEAWKDLLNVLIRSYNSNGFEAWTIPCLYVAGKHLREFAIRADIERNSSNALDSSAEANFQDDFNPESEQNQKLEDCARQLNRVFNLCLSDRFVAALHARKGHPNQRLGRRWRIRENGGSIT